MYRAWRDADNNREDEGISGLYFVSVTVQAIEPGSFNENPTPLMNLDIMTVDSTHNTPGRMIRFQLLESDFFDTAHQAISTPIEVVLGEIEIRQTAQGVVFVDERRPNNTAWTDTILTKSVNVITRDQYWNPDSVSAKLDSLDIRLSYAEGTATFLLDAVCLSSPRTFAMYYPNDPIFAVNGPLENWRNIRAGYLHRLDAVLRDNGKAAGTFPNLRFLIGPEHDRHAAKWPLISIAEQLLDSASGGNVGIYCWLGYSEEPTVSAAFSRRFASGYYSYPIPVDYVRPVYPDSTPGSYHHQLNRMVIRGFGETAIRFRKHAETRSQITNVHPWLPAVQNHSNMYETDPPGWYDDDPLREPTAAELRHQCNIPLAFGADGVMFWAFVSAPWTTSNPFWPADTNEWKSAGFGAIDPAAGTLGFLDLDLARRRCDWNGESKWDSAAVYINGFLQPIGDFIHQSLDWQNAKTWNLQYIGDAGSNEMVTKVLSMRQDAPIPIDPPDSTFVTVSEFEHHTSMKKYLFVVNGRTHPTEGHRHITVKLASNGGDDTQWKVTKILGADEEGDIWIVRPHDTPDNTTTANGFTDYFEPGTAGLYRIEPFDEDTVGQSGICYNSNITITPGATVALSNTSLIIAASLSITVEDSLYMYNTVLSCCDAESAAHLVVRDGGGMLANQSEIENVSISIGPESHATLLGTAITPLAGTEAIYVADGSVTTYRNEIDLTSGGTFICSYGNSELRLTADSVFGNYVTYASGLEISGGCCYVRGLTMKGLGFGLSALNNSYISGSDFSNPDFGENKIWTDMVCLYATGSSEIFMGEQPWGGKAGLYASHNSLGILSTGYHASNAGGSIFAQENFYGTGSGPVLTPSAPLISGAVDTSSALQTDPVPFTGTRDRNDQIDGQGTSGPTLAQATGSIPSFAFSTSGQLRSTVNQLLAANQKSLARSAISAFFTNISGMNIAAIPAEDLHFIYRTLGYVDGREMLGDLTSLCLAHPNMRTKLLLSDILAREGLMRNALTVLNSYSFIGSPALHRDALLRKAILYPLSKQGGYNDGLAVLDTLAQLAANDTTLRRFLDRYPLLFSRLTHSPDTSGSRKKHVEILARTTPMGFTIGQNYPNPFQDVTSFTFKLEQPTHVRLLVYNAMGRQVASVTDADYNRGIHSCVLRSAHLPSGLYFYRFITLGGVIQRKMVLLR